MGTTAEKLTYLNDTKQLLKENINSLGGNLTTEPFRQYASVLEGIYERIPKVSGIGASLSLSPTMVGRIKLNEIKGNTLQDGTPTPDTPVEIQSVTGLQNANVCGKNLFDKNKCELVGGVAFNNTENNVYTITSGTTRNFVIIQVKPSTIYTISVNRSRAFLGELKTKTTEAGNGSNSWVNSEKTFTTTSRTNYIGLLIEMADLTNFTMQVEQGSTATSYEPYKGNTYEVNLGKNLFDIQGIVKGRLDNGVIGYASDVSNLTLNDNSFSFTTTANYRGVTSDYIKINGTKCVFSNKSITFGSSLNVVVACYNNSKTFLSNASLGSANLTYMVATLPSNTSYIRVYLYLNSAGTITIEEPQLEKGSTATSYSPYFTPIELNKIGDYKDRIYKDNGKWYVEKQTGKVVLDGSENWQKNFGDNLFNLTYDFSFIVGYGLSNYYKYNPVQSGINANTVNGDFVLQKSGGYYVIFIKNTSIITIDNFKTWLSTHNTEIIYPLATPTYTEITNTELIEDLETLYTAKSQEGTTNISITSEDLEMILNVSALKGDVE